MLDVFIDINIIKNHIGLIIYVISDHRSIKKNTTTEI